MRWVYMIPSIVLLVGSCVHGGVLVQDGKPQATIVLPKQAGPAVQLAGSELQRYVEAISGAKLPVVAEGEQVEGLPIYVGGTAVTAALVPKQPETILIRGDEQRLMVCGGSDRATLWAVYRFLEEALGCRWLAWNVEDIPHQATLLVPALKIETAPAFNMRVFGASGDRARMWGMKMGMDGFYSPAQAPLTGNCFYWPDAIQGCHAYHQILPPDEYYPQHPEWFPLINGQRFRSSGETGQLCVTAPGLADEIARRVCEVFAADPNLQVTSISPNDGYGWCECEQCRALDQQLNGGRTTRQGLAGEQPFMGDRVFWFANQIAERVGKVYPDKLLLVLAYVNYAEPPDTVKPAPNVVPWLCHYAPADYSRPIQDPTSEANAQFNALLKRWAKTAPHLLFYSYVSKSMWWRLPRPVMHGFATDLKYLYSLGIRRYYCQSSLNDWALDGPLYYVLAKLMWDPKGDPDTIAQDWISHMFGGAAPEMTQYYAAAERSVRKTGRSYSDNPYRQVAGLYDMGELEQALAHLQAARKAADNEEIGTRIDEVTKVFQYGLHMIRCLEAGTRFRNQQTRADLEELRREGALALRFCQVREAQEYVDSFRFFEELGVLGNGFGKAEQLGGRQCWNTDETGLGDGKAGWADFFIETPDTTKPAVVEMEVWGKSNLGGIVINSDGTGKGYSQGGVWNPVQPEKALSGQEQWETLVFTIKPELLAKGRQSQHIGLGGADSQIWIAKIRVRTMAQ